MSGAGEGAGAGKQEEAKVTPIPVNTPVLDGNEKKYLTECIETGWISSFGPFVGRFEEGMCKVTGRKHAIACTNGSAAIDMAIAALGIEKGDEVIMPTFTIISCISEMARRGVTVKLVDCDESYNIDVTKIEEQITEKTKAIMVVHIYHFAVDMDPVLALAKKHNLYVIEDAAEMIGQTYKGKPCGGFGDVSTMSFYPNKHITTGEGGMVLTSNDEIAEKLRQFRNLCFIPPRRFVHEEIGWNNRFTNMQAALGLAQLERLDATIVKKRAIGARYQELLAGTPGLVLPPAELNGEKNIYWVFGCEVAADVKVDAQWVQDELAKRKVGSRPFFYPMHMQPVFNKQGLYTDLSCPISERATARGFYVPSGLGLSEADQDRVVKELKEIMAIAVAKKE